MKLTTDLPLSTLFFKHWHDDDTEVGVIVAKARFVRDRDGRLQADRPPPPLAMVDRFAGDPATSPLRAEQDIAPYKPATDLMLHAVAHAPGGTPAKDWAVTVAVPGRLHFALHVRGPCAWRRNGRNWVLDGPRAVTQVPLDFALAHGGVLLESDGAVTDHDPLNPAGCGFATAAALDGQDTWPAAQIGDLAEMIAATGPLSPLSVRGTGPVAKTWLPRRALAGTFDEAWQRSRHPRMPADYDLAYWNAAPSGLQLRPHLRGDEMVVLTGMDPGPAPLTIQLPGQALSVDMTGDATGRSRMTVDTVTLDLTAGTAIVEIIWRALIRTPGAYDAGHITAHDLPPKES